MTLLELLVKELQKLGGWPEGAECAVQDRDTQLCFSSHANVVINVGKTEWLDGQWSGGWSNPYLDELADDHSTAIITREQYESALAASQKAEWSGDGLPPAGCECEWQDKNTKQWQPVKIVYASEWVTVIREINKEKGNDLVEIAIENYGDDAMLKFRPLSSDADKKRDVAAKEMARHANEDENRGFDAGLRNCLSIYDAIAAGKIPGVKLDD